jgi:hypothetical protein
MKLISYIQPFVEESKRTARIVSNAILINYKYCPILFRTVDSVSKQLPAHTCNTLNPDHIGISLKPAYIYLKFNKRGRFLGGLRYLRTTDNKTEPKRYYGRMIIKPTLLTNIKNISP